MGNNYTEFNDSVTGFVIAAENETGPEYGSIPDESFFEAELIDRTSEEDEYGFSSSPETLELLCGLSQNAREALELEKVEQEKDPDPEVEPQSELDPVKQRSIAESEASQRQRGRADLPRNRLPVDLIAHYFGQKDLVPTMVKVMKALRKSVEMRPECIDTGVKRMLKEFPDDEQLCTNLALRFNYGSAKLFSSDNITAGSLLSSPSHALPIVWARSRTGLYPPLWSFEEDKQKGLHKRGVYLLELWKPSSEHPGHFHMFAYVGSGRSAKGGMLYRSIQHADPKYRAEHPTILLYKHLKEPWVSHRVYALCEWPAIAQPPSKEETYDEILLLEAMCQIRLGTGCPKGMSKFFREAQDCFDVENPRTVVYRGLNRESALEKTRRYGAAVQPFP
jgi:hypothetical protein